MSIIKSLEGLLEKGQDTALLRYGLADAYLKEKKLDQAIASLGKAVELDPDYSAAWKLLGKTLTEAGKSKAAMAAYEKGIVAAEKKGDKQAAKEMGVFLMRLKK
jgi:Tfp pilus assembly protein PilF